MSNSADASAPLRARLARYAALALVLAGIGAALFYVSLPRLLANNARYWLERNRPYDALERIEQAEARGLDPAAAAPLRFRALMGANKYGQALAAADAMEANDVMTPAALRDAALAALETGNASLANRWLHRLSEAADAPARDRALAAGLLAARAGEFAVAARELRNARSQSGSMNFHWSFALGESLRRSGDPLSAIPYLERALSARGGVLEPLREVARCYRDAELTDSFRHALDRLRRAGADPMPIVWENAAAKEWTDAAARDEAAMPPPDGLSLLFQEAPAPEPQGAARIVVSLERWSRAGDLIEFGVALESADRLDEAREAFEAATRSDPNLFEARYQAARLDPAIPAADALKAAQSQAPWRARRALSGGNEFMGPGDAELFFNSGYDDYRRGGPWKLILEVRPPPGDPMGEWFEVAIGDRVHRRYFDKAAPRLLQFDVGRRGDKSLSVKSGTILYNISAFEIENAAPRPRIADHSSTDTTSMSNVPSQRSN